MGVRVLTNENTPKHQHLTNERVLRTMVGGVFYLRKGGASMCQAHVASGGDALICRYPGTPAAEWVAEGPRSVAHT